MAAQDDDVDEEIVSGPYCRHWDSFGCEEMCTCGHPCVRHDNYGGEACLEPGCTCLQFTDKED